MFDFWDIFYCCFSLIFFYKLYLPCFLVFLFLITSDTQLSRNTGIHWKWKGSKYQVLIPQYAISCYKMNGPEWSCWSWLPYWLDQSASHTKMKIPELFSFYENLKNIDYITVKNNVSLFPCHLSVIPSESVCEAWVPMSVFSLVHCHRTALLVFWPLKPAVSSDWSIPAWQSHKMGNI